MNGAVRGKTFMESFHQRFDSWAIDNDLVDLGTEDMQGYDPYMDGLQNG